MTVKPRTQVTSQSSIKGSGLVHACYESVRCFGEKFALKCNDFRNTNVCPLTERPDADYNFQVNQIKRQVFKCRIPTLCSLYRCVFASLSLWSPKSV